MRPHSEGLDFLSLTVSTAEGSRLMEPWTESIEEGGGVRGFNKSERRACLGGWCWRRWEPWSESKAHGRDYECWEWASHVADGVACWLPEGVRGASSRLDYRFDFDVPEGVLADHVAEAVRPHADESRISMGLTGQAGINTHYVGSVRSDRRLRIYRVDLKQKSLPYEVGPRLRVELILKGDLALASWAQFLDDRAAAVAAFRTHVAQMGGLQFGALGVLPSPPVDECERESQQQIFAFLEQHGDMIEACRQVGISVEDLARARWQRTEPSRVRVCRMNARLAAFASLDPGVLLLRFVRAWRARLAAGAGLD